MRILVCGGAGYIGSHMCKLLAQRGHEPVTFDNLSTGHAWAVKWGPLIEGDLLDRNDLTAMCINHRFDAIMHFAARSLVVESVREPALYFHNNVVGTLNLLDAMRAAQVGKLVFSSSAAVYGNPRYSPIDETHPCMPINAYGWSKLISERAIAEYCRAYGLHAVCLRYFNAAGADSEGEIGEVHNPETHLIPNILEAALKPSAGPVKIFGKDYDTPDGTCVRDYIHVEDVCLAHLRAVDFLDTHDGCHIFNLGAGIGHSVGQVLSACRSACSGRPASVFAPPRPGDPAQLIASCAAANQMLNWRAVYGLDRIINDALAWHRRAICDH